MSFKGRRNIFMKSLRVEAILCTVYMYISTMCFSVTADERGMNEEIE